jgi:tetratricopeptide (TPR) repeat protein
MGSIGESTIIQQRDATGSKPIKRRSAWTAKCSELCADCNDCDCVRSWAINPNNAEALSNLALLHFNREEYEKTGKLSDKSLRLYPSQLRTCYYFGSCFESLVKFGVATTAHNNAIRHSSGTSEQAIRGLLRIRLVRGELANLDSFLDRLEHDLGSDTLIPERVMYLVAHNSKQMRDELNFWTESHSSMTHDAPFHYQALGRCLLLLGRLSNC